MSKPTLAPADDAMAQLIQQTATALWDVSETIRATGWATAGDWEQARSEASRLLAALERPETPRPHPLTTRSRTAERQESQ